MTTEIVKESIGQRQSAYTSRTAFDDRRIGAAAIYCSDGRFGEQMDEFLHEGLALPRYDRLAIPGGAGCLAGHTCAYHEKNALSRQLDFLIHAHSLTRVVLIAHDGCGFYKELYLSRRTIEEQQAADLAKAAMLIRTSNPKVEVNAFFARKNGGRIVFERWPIDA